MIHRLRLAALKLVYINLASLPWQLAPIYLFFIFISFIPSHPISFYFSSLKKLISKSKSAHFIIVQYSFDSNMTHSLHLYRKRSLCSKNTFIHSNCAHTVIINCAAWLFFRPSFVPYKVRGTNCVKWTFKKTRYDRAETCTNMHKHAQTCLCQAKTCFLQPYFWISWVAHLVVSRHAMKLYTQ